MQYFLVEVYHATTTSWTVHFLHYFRNTLKDSLWSCGMFLVFKARDIYSVVLPFGTSLNLLYGGFVFLSLLCDIQICYCWALLTNIAAHYINLSQQVMSFSVLLLCKLTINKQCTKTKLSKKQDLLYKKYFQIQTDYLTLQAS